MLSDEKRLLIQILARVDALFWPDRERFTLARDQVREERRAAYRESGLPFVAGGSAADRQSTGRLLETLENGGLLTIHRRSQRVGVKLTPLGDAITRRLCGEVTLTEAWGHLATMVEIDRTYGPGLWPEHLAIGVHEFTGSKAENDALKDFRQTIVPLLPLGYLTYKGDMAYPRRYWMSVTDAGRGAFSAGPPAAAPDEIRYDSESADFYDHEWDRATAELDAAEPDEPSNLVIPVPCGIGWGSLAAWKGQA